jgi:PKD repeat protein
MSRVDLLHPRPSRGGASRRLASPVRRLIGGFTIALLIAASAARVASAQPPPDSPTNALAFLQWCWQNRDVAHYHEVFADNFQYYFDYQNPAGVPYLATPWSRTDELTSAANLFAGGSTQAPASNVTFTFTDGPNLQPAGPGYPWHQQLVAQWSLDITCTDGTTKHAEGQSRWFVVRGDSAQIPQELQDRGFVPDSMRWYVERWLEEQNTNPIVLAPSQVNAKVGIPITLQITAQDPNDEPITSFMVLSNLGQFTDGPNNASGTYIFTPTEAGTFGMSFEAVNSLAGTATTFINVVMGNAPPVASLVLKPGGAGPQSVTADGSGSHDVDGQIVSYGFNFGDGTVVGPQSLSTANHTYSQGGNFPITLVVTDNSGATASMTVRDTVIGPPTASLTVSPTSGVVPLSVTADGSHSSGPRPIESYRFDFGDGTILGPWTSPTATHTYTRGGIWPVTLKVTDNAGGTASTTVSDTAIVAPVASLLMFPNTGVAPLQVTADASHSSGTGPITSYRFDFGDGTVVGPQTNATATHTYAIGNWVASVRVTDSHGATASASASVNVTTSDPLGQLANLCKNPSFEVNTAGWESFYGSTIAIVPGGHDGSYALQMTGTTAVDYGFGVNDHPDWVHPTTVAGRT